MSQGWIDLQVNGYAGIDFNSPLLTVEAVKTATERLAAAGTIGYLPTLITGNPETILHSIRTVIQARQKYALCEKNILGFFLEGPFISRELGAVGTHPLEWVRAPDEHLIQRFQDAAQGTIRLINVAAEVPQMPDFIRKLKAMGIAVSLGHQMACSPQDIAPCIAAGATAFTHLGNGIPNKIDRHNNIIFTALVEEQASIMFIPDGHHLPETLLKLYCRAVPLTRLIAVSDSQYPAGLPPGEYEVCGAHARLEPNGLLWNPARNCLVGATTPLAKCMAHLKSCVGLTDAECKLIGHDNPLRLIHAPV